jgi:hypothetical protein
MLSLVPDASGALCHLVRLADGSQGGRLPAKQRSIVGKFNELPALQRVSARAVVARDGLRKAIAPHNFETLSFQALSFQASPCQALPFQALPCQALPCSLGFFVFAILVAS